MVQDAPDQRLLGREVIVDGRDVDPGPSRDVPGPETLEASFGNLVERRLDELLAPLLLARGLSQRWLYLTQSRLIKQLIGFARRTDLVTSLPGH